MKFIMKKIILTGFITFIYICLLTCNVIATDSESTVYYKEDFSYHYCADTVTVNVNLKDEKANTLTVNDVNGNKCLGFTRTISDPHINFPVSDMTVPFVVQCDFYQPEKNGGDMEIGIANTKYYVKVDEYGYIMLPDGKTVIGSLRKGFTNIALAVDAPNSRYKVYINKKAVTDYITVADSGSLTSSMLRIYFYNTGSKSSVNIDNLLIYSGNTLIDIADYGGYSKAVLPDNNAAIKQVGNNSIAVHSMAKRAIINGSRTDLVVKPEFIDSELWIPAEVMEKAGYLVDTEQMTVSGKAVDFKTINSTYYICLSQTAQALGLNYYTDKDGYGFDKGFAIMGDSDYSEFADNFSLYSGANNYLVYKRPEADEIKEALLKNSGGKHPRLLATQSEFDTLKQQILTDSVKKEWAENIIETADMYLTYGLPSHELDGARLNSLHGMSDRVFTLCLAYKLTDNSEYADKVYEDLVYMGTRSDWNPGHFLDIGVGTTCYAIAYDWLYDYWNDTTQKPVLENIMLKKSLNYVHNSLYNGQYTSWLDETVGEGLTGNWPIVCFSGPVMASIAMMEEYPDICSGIVRDAFRGIEYTLKGFADEGDWTESTFYWSYTNKYLSFLLGSCDSALGTDFGYYYDIPGLKDTVSYAISMVTPGGTFNYGDAEGSTLDLFSAQWHASKLSLVDKEAADEISKFILKYYDIKNISGGFWDILKMDTSVGENPQKLSEEYISQKLGMGVVRTSWSLTDETYLGYVYGAKVRQSHNHYDHGSFVFEAMGEEWATDLGRDNYDIPNYYTDAYRVRAEGHNTFVVNPDLSPGQDKDNHHNSLLKKYNSDEEYFSIVDLTKSYNEDVTSAQRGFWLGEGKKTLVIHDEISFKDKSEFYWFMHTPAIVNVENGNVAYLTSSDMTKTMKLEFIANQPLELMCMSPEPLSSSPVPKGEYTNNVNSGIRKICIKGSVEGNLVLTVKLTPMDGGTYSDIENKPLSEWKSELEPPNEENFIYPSLRALKINGILYEDFNDDIKYYVIPVDYEQGEPFIECIPDYACEVLTEKTGDYSYKITLKDNTNNLSTEYTIVFKEQSGQYNNSLVKKGIAIGSVNLYSKNSEDKYIYTDELTSGENVAGINIKNASENSRAVYVIASYNHKGKRKNLMQSCTLAPGEQQFIKLAFNIGSDYGSLVFNVLDVE